MVAHQPSKNEKLHVIVQQKSYWKAPFGGGPAPKQNCQELCTNFTLTIMVETDVASLHALPLFIIQISYTV